MTYRILRHLNKNRVSGFKSQLDSSGLALQTGRIPVNFPGIQNSVAHLSDVDKSRFHAGQNVLHTSQVNIAHCRNFVNVGNVMFNENVVFDNGNLRVLFFLAHDHESIYHFAASQEILLGYQRLTRSVATIVPAPLSFCFQTRRTLNISNFIDILLLARTKHRVRIRFARTMTPAAAGYDRGFLRISVNADSLRAVTAVHHV